jgi:hypothetical protein
MRKKAITNPYSTAPLIPSARRHAAIQDPGGEVNAEVGPRTIGER